MSGNHDYPPASRRGRGNRAGDRPPRPTATHLQHLRDLLTSDRSRETSARALETLNREISHYRRSQDRPAFEETRAAVDRQVQENRSRREDNPHGGLPRHLRPAMPRLQTLNVTVVDPDTSSPDSSRSPGGSSRRRTQRGSRPSQDLNRRESSTSLLDEPVPPLDTSPIIPQPQEEEEEDSMMDRWRVKRRKLDSDDNREGPQSFRYGHYGQVVPGPLKMEMESCDGGLFEPEGELASPTNVLRSDSSFYSTKSDRCNIILRHCGESPFCLKRIVIKAPKHGYDTPMQEGMVFVAMGSEELVAQATDYQYHHTHGRQRRYRRSGMQPSQEYLNAYRTPLQTLERVTLPGRESNPESGPNTNDSTRSIANSRPRPVSDFRVTMDYGERSERSGYDDLDFAGPESSAVDTDWLSMDEMDEDLLCSDNEISDDDLSMGELGSFHQSRRGLQRQVRAMRRQHAIEQGRLPRRPPAPSAYHPSSSSGPGQTPEPGPFMAHACFSIERTKNVVNIKFDPPPSGRYILLQLWCPQGDNSIDIQSIVAYGFAGPRFFPAGTFR
ncbi:hypothetical protein P170DRAFT_89763 [Aspergillus steynii IBT 23096]|uniref:Uncharacterized protein n=1 Tax=Aspergillus steynii IBT 23096 TaxID=1392250 RepID=A0A2I2GG20_9EURO|nr:uncharacterized protein P170DRAFT_89763 [Aspergillus steynii IBT 23096]PLB51836.1 hypothetical protein P170DRAFT_89763 [Aspergillus steynii IBT 23096]